MLELTLTLVALVATLLGWPSCGTPSGLDGLNDRTPQPILGASST
jgi:hypothetical protein